MGFLEGKYASLGLTRRFFQVYPEPLDHPPHLAVRCLARTAAFGAEKDDLDSTQARESIWHAIFNQYQHYARLPNSAAVWLAGPDINRLRAPYFGGLR
mgnify:CR=1 FL=1